MEMIYDLRYRGLFALPWERGARGCVLLIFFGILFLCVKACPTVDEVRRERIVVNRRVNVIPGIESKNICDDNSECILIGFRNQSMSLAVTNSKEIKKSVIKTAKVKGTKIREDGSRAEDNPESMKPIGNENISIEDINVDRTIEVIMSENDVSEIVMTPEFSDNNVGTSESDVENSRTPETVIIESIEPETDIKEPEATEGKEDNESIISDNESTVDKEEGKIIEGFLVDAQGYITGVTDDLVLLDEILVIAADQGCVGIREDAFSDIEGVVTEIYIPANIHDIEPEAFRYFQDLIYIEVSEENPYYNSVDGILYSSSGDEIVCPVGR